MHFVQTNRRIISSPVILSSIENPHVKKLQVHTSHILILIENVTWCFSIAATVITSCAPQKWCNKNELLSVCMLTLVFCLKLTTFTKANCSSSVTLQKASRSCPSSCITIQWYSIVHDLLCEDHKAETQKLGMIPKEMPMDTYKRKSKALLPQRIHTKETEFADASRRKQKVGQHQPQVFYKTSKSSSQLNKSSTPTFKPQQIQKSKTNQYISMQLSIPSASGKIQRFEFPRKW